MKGAYDALQRGDGDAYLALIDSPVRAYPNPLLKARPNFRDMAYQMTSCEGKWAEVHVLGTLRLGEPVSETPLNTTEVAHLVGTQWLLSSPILRSQDPEWNALRQQTAQALATAQARVKLQATATATAIENRLRLAEADAAIAENDWYVAATILRNILLLEPENQEAKERLTKVSPHAPGGLITRYDGSNSGPQYYAFSSPSGEPLSNWPKDMGLAQIDPTGRYASLTARGLDYKIRRLDLATGLLEVLAWPGDLDECPTCNDYYLSPNGLKLALWSWGTIVVYDRTKQRNVGPCPAPERFGSQGTFRWMADSRMIIAQAGSSPVQIMDTDTGACSTVKLPGLTSGVAVLLHPSNQQILIFVPGQILTADLTGSSIKKLLDLPKGFENRTVNNVFVSPDQGAIYLDGTIQSLKTGRSAPFLTKGKEITPINYTAMWVDRRPASSQLNPPTLSVTPLMGPRGTRFAFKLNGAPANREIAWSVRGPTGEVLKGSTILANAGALSDSGGPNGFGLTAGLNHRAGKYEVEVTIDAKVVANGEFEITE